MREFTEEEFSAIKNSKWKCKYKKEGESFSLTNTRFTRSYIGDFPGTWFKTDATIKFTAEITPAGDHELRFRISGMIPSFNGEGGPKVELADIIDRTLTYSKTGTKANTKAYMWFQSELELLIYKFFFLAENIVQGYSMLIFALKCGHRFTNRTEVIINNCLNVKPEEFMK